MTQWIINFKDLTLKDLPQVGGKNASLGEMISHLTELDVDVPGGFATTADSYRNFLAQDGLDKKIESWLDNLDIDDVRALQSMGLKIREAILNQPLPDELTSAIRDAYQLLQTNTPGAVAVRSSATAEDLPDASFAGQQETYLHIDGIDNVLTALKKVYASLYTDRAIAYRTHQGFAHHEVALSVGVQSMVHSDNAASGVLFTLDTESGFDKVMFITAAYGLGEMVVQGAVNPDEFYVYKPSLAANKSAIVRRHCGTKREKMVSDPENNNIKTVPVSEDLQSQFCLTDEEVHTLARHALTIEKHYKRPMDIEWAKDSRTQKLYILQARPETVQSRAKGTVLERYSIHQDKKIILAEGRSVGQKIGQGSARVLKNLNEMDNVKAGDVLVTDMTDPDWEPIMKRASAIVTNRGGRTCHAAIIARELGIPAIVGCGDATDKVPANEPVTVSCAEGETGFIYQGAVPFEIDKLDVGNLPELPLKVMLNVANPERAFTFHQLPNHGVGLARLEFIISSDIGIHPLALLNLETIPKDIREQIEIKTAAYESPIEYYIEKLKEGIATIACTFAPNPVIVRLSDFKSNEYANLLGGNLFEPDEENPMLGFRGAGRYFSDMFESAFALECEAVKRVRNDMGLSNVQIMIPFVRTVKEAEAVIDVLAQNNLKRGEKNLKIIMMCEIPSNALLADQFLEYFDGFSIGSNDLTQLTLGIDRDSSLVAAGFDERNDAVKLLLSKAISACKAKNKYVGICGQGPSDHKDFALWLLEQGIESVSLNPDSVLETWLFLSKSGN